MALYCHSCKAKTETTSPVFIKTFDKGGFCVYGICVLCLGTKHKFLNDWEISQLHNSLREIPPRSTVLEYINNNDGEKVRIFPLINTLIN